MVEKHGREQIIHIKTSYLVSFFRISYIYLRHKWEKVHRRRRCSYSNWNRQY